MVNYNNINMYRSLEHIADTYAAGNITSAQLIRLQSMFMINSTKRSAERLGIMTPDYGHMRHEEKYHD